MGDVAWPFLIGRTRTEDHRIVVIPEFMTDPPLASALRASVSGDPMEPDSAAVREIQVTQGRVVTVVYRVSIARAEPYGIPGDPGQGTLTDSHGRPILITEGLVLRQAASDVMRSGVPQAAMDQAHALVVPAYQAFWTEERQFTRQVSHALPVAPNGSPQVRLQYRPDVPTPLPELQPPQPQCPEPVPAGDGRATAAEAQACSPRYHRRSRAATLALIGAVSALALLVPTGAGLLAVKLLRPGSQTSPTAQPAPSGSRSTANPVIGACAAGSLQFIGSTAFMPIAQAAAKEYTRACTGAKIMVTGGSAAYGLTQLLDAVHSGSPSAGSLIAMYDGLPSATHTAGLSTYTMGVLIFSVVAHTRLFPGNITTGELRKIFVKPGEQGVVAVGGRAGAGSRGAFIENVLKQDPGPPDPDSCPPPTGRPSRLTGCTEDSTADVLNFVNGTPNAIGYAAVYGSLVGFPEVSVIRIDNAAPTPDNVRNGSYDFWTVEHLYAAMHPTALTKDFLDFLPHYIESYMPPDFIACSDSPRLTADC